MDRLLKYGSVEAIPFYNCSWKSEEEWWTTGVKHPILGLTVLSIGAPIEVLYCIVIYIIFKTKLIKHACYKIMLLLAVNDMGATVCSSLITGTLLYQGSVFCSYPTFTYISGAFALGTWVTACAITVSLFANRIVSIVFQEYADIIEKRLAYSSMVLSVLYMFYFLIFTPPCVYNSYVMAWIPDPLSEEVPSAEASAWYKNRPQAWNNWIFVTCMFILFSIYCGLVNKLARGQKSKASRSIFIQCSIICFFNTVIALIYNALPYITLDPWILIFCQLCWTINHSLPAVIYVTMNVTIRREFRKIVFGKIFRIDEKRSSQMTGVVSSAVSSNSRI